MNKAESCPELDMEYREEGSGVIEYFDDLTSRLQQIKSISIMARLDLQLISDSPTVAQCLLEEAFNSIEIIAGNHSG